MYHRIDHSDIARQKQHVSTVINVLIAAIIIAVLTLVMVFPAV
jgi:hypothetical protein